MESARVETVHEEPVFRRRTEVPRRADRSALIGWNQAQYYQSVRYSDVNLPLGYVKPSHGIFGPCKR
jgi:hypothetical protein